MKRSLAASNATVLANAFNPSVVRESFLVAQGIIAAEEQLGPGFVFTDQVASVSTARFQLVVAPQQLQVVPHSRETAEDVVSAVVIPLVNALPYTPYIAAGINFVWLLEPLGESVAAASRRLFGPRPTLFGSAFEAPNACFGFFASEDLENVRVRLDVKPVNLVGQDGSRSEAIQCAFNYHLDLTPGSAPSAIAALCSRWFEFDRHAERLSAVVAESGTT